MAKQAREPREPSPNRTTPPTRPIHHTKTVPDQIPKEMGQIKTNKEAQSGLPYSILALPPPGTRVHRVHVSHAHRADHLIVHVLRSLV